MLATGTEESRIGPLVLVIVSVASLIFLVPIHINSQSQLSQADQIVGNTTANDPEFEFDRQVLFYAVLQSVIAAVGIAAGIGITFYLYWREQKGRRLETIDRACQTILWELNDNKKTLSEGGEFQKISYDIGRQVSEQTSQENARKVLYTNAYLYDEAYKSLINSGSFSYLKSDTQYKLASLYGRIKSHNELLTYVDQLQDQILFSGTLAESKDEEKSNAAFTRREHALFQLRERYDLTLTKWEAEITSLIPETEKLIVSEKSGN